MHSARGASSTTYAEVSQGLSAGNTPRLTSSALEGCLDYPGAAVSLTREAPSTNIDTGGGLAFRLRVLLNFSRP